MHFPPGILHMAYGAFWFSAMSLLVKVAGQRIPAMEVVLVRGVFTLLLSAGLLARTRTRPFGTHRGLLFLRGLLGTLALSAFYFSLVHLPLAEASVIQYTNPVFTAVLAAVLLGEALGRREIACVLASLAGVVLVARPAALFGGTSEIPVAYATIALAGAVCSAGAYVCIRRIGRREPPLVVVFWLPLVTVPLTTPFAAREWTWPTGMEWLALLGIGVTTQLAQLQMTRGLQLETAARATAVGYLQVVFATLWGLLVFREIPDPWTIAGATVIVVSTVALAASRRPG